MKNVFTFVAMKRAISIFLLFTLLVTAVEPTLAFHFCGGSFHSVGIGDAGRSCCAGDMDAEPGGSTALAEHQESCCSGYTVEISTDNYQKTSTLSTIPALRMDTLFIPYLHCSVADNYSLSALYLKTTFPPGGHPNHTADLLALICVLRI
jgi:hypothetical protein